MPRVVYLGCQCLWRRGTHTAGQCHKSPGTSRLDLGACLDHEMLLIVDSFQGGRQDGHVVGRPNMDRHSVCRYTVSDCVEGITAELSSRLAKTCVGRSRCSVLVDVGWMRSCNSFADYTQVTYQCIPSEFRLATML